jgi:hypothetical protein
VPRATVAARRRRRALVGALALVVAGGIAAGTVLLTQGGARSAQALPRPDSNVFLAASDGKVIGQASARGTVKVRFGFGSLWSVSRDGELTRVDPATGKTIATLRTRHHAERARRRRGVGLGDGL